MKTIAQYVHFDLVDIYLEDWNTLVKIMIVSILNNNINMLHLSDHHNVRNSENVVSRLVETGLQL